MASQRFKITILCHTPTFIIITQGLKVHAMIHIGLAFVIVITMAIVVSHFGILDSPEDPISINKIIGASLVMVGADISTS